MSIWRFVASVAFVMITAMVSTPAAASDEKSELERAQATRTVIENGVLISLGEDSLLRYDVAAGAVSLRYANGAHFEFGNSVSSMRKVEVPAETLIWVRDDRGQAKGGNCGGLAAALTDAIATVQSACAGGSSASCDMAIATMQSLYSDYLQCLTQLR